MDIIFFGTSNFAVLPLKALSLSRHNILSVVTAPDRRGGRGRRISFSPMKIFAQRNGLPLLQPEDLRDSEFILSLKNKSSDLFVVCAYGKILTKEILQIPRLYAINLHASILPKYRGAAPINWTIIKGEHHTGITIFKMNEHMDRGEIILQERIAISNSDSAISLSEKLSNLGKDNLLKAIDLIEHNEVTFTKQDESKALLAPKLKKKDGLIDWQEPAYAIHNRIRGLQPWPGAFTYLNNKLLKIWQSAVVKSKKQNYPGEIAGVDKNGILVQTGKDNLLITVLQLEGKTKMSVDEFILGHKLKVGERLGRIKRKE